MRTAPCHLLVLIEFEQQFQLRAKEHVVVALVLIKDREGNWRRSATGDEVDTTRGDRCCSSELLKDTDRLIGRQHRNRRTKLDRARRGSGGVNKRCWRRYWHRARVVLAEAEEIEADFFRKMHRFKDITDRLRGRAVATVSSSRRVAKGVDAEFKRLVGFHGQYSLGWVKDTFDLVALRVQIPVEWCDVLRFSTGLLADPGIDGDMSKLSRSKVV